MMDKSIWVINKENTGSAVDHVVDTFRSALIERQLKAGDRIPSESELAEYMGVSRSTIREAMKVLSSFGIVDICRGNGTFIAENDEQVSMDSVLFAFLLAQPTREEQLECRRCMERVVYELAFENATEEDIAALEANYAELLQLGGNPKLSAENDLEFHRLLGKSTGNRLIARLYAYTMNFFAASLASSHVKNEGAAARRVHKLTIEAIQKRDRALLEQVEAECLRSWSSDAHSLYFE